MENLIKDCNNEYCPKHAHDNSKNDQNENKQDNQIRETELQNQSGLTNKEEKSN